VDVKEFLSHYIKTEQGNVLNENGEVIGTHPGALFFTKGERRGFILTNKTPNDLPYFVIDKDIEKNTITVSNKEIDGKLPGSEKQVRISNVNWVSGEVPDITNSKSGFTLLARSRYRQVLQKIRIVSASITETILEFENSQDSLTPGQSLVIYNGEKCLGGGVIC